MKLINFKCFSCQYNTEILILDKEEEERLGIPECPQCSENMERFNFKNNTQRVFICDSPYKQNKTNTNS